LGFLENGLSLNCLNTLIFKIMAIFVLLVLCLYVILGFMIIIAHDHENTDSIVVGTFIITTGALAIIFECLKL